MFAVRGELVAEGADALVRAQRVVAAEGAVLPSLRTLVHILARAWGQNTIILYTFTIYTVIYPPLGPGANPWLHWHMKPPLVLEQVPLPHTAPVPHSSISSHTRPVESRRKPSEWYQVER